VVVTRVLAACGLTVALTVAVLVLAVVYDWVVRL
jgi:hypothetical protein